MATFKEKINSLRELKTTLKTIMTENGVDLTNVPFTEYSSKLSEMQLGGAGGGGFVEVDSLPTDNIDADKVYKTFNYEGEFYINVDAVGNVIKISEVMMSNGVPQPYVYYYVDDIQNVKDPIDIQESSSTSGDLPIYVDKNFIGWHYSKELPDFPNEWFTLGEYFTLLLKLFGVDTTIVNGGKIDSIDQIPADQVCFLPDLEKSKEIIGVPNVENDKTIMHYEGSEWVELAVPAEPPTLISKTIVENGTYDATLDGADGYTRVSVNVNTTPILQEKIVTESGEVVPDAGYDGLSRVIVDVPAVGYSMRGILNGDGTQTVEITSLNGEDSTWANDTSNDKKYFVKVIDYDGTVLKEAHLNTGDSFMLPDEPTHEGLVFKKWVSSQEIDGNIITVADNNVMVGALYSTQSKLSEIDIELTNKTGLNITLNMQGTKDWGDGTIDDLTTHTYVEHGKYTITCNGTAVNGALFGQTKSNVNYSCVGVRFGNITSLGQYSFQYCQSLKYVIIPKTLGSLGGYSFMHCHSLRSIIIPNISLSLGWIFQYCYSLKDVVMEYGIREIGPSDFEECYGLTNVAIPISVRIIGKYAFSKNYVLKNIIIPYGVTSIAERCFASCYSLTDMVIPNSMSEISEGLLNNCYSLKNIVIPDSIVTIKGNAIVRPYSLTNITLPNSITSIGEHTLSYCYALRSLVIPASITSIGGSSFHSCYSLTEYDFSNHSSVPLLLDTYAFTNINGMAKIYVPDSLYDEWIAATNWSTYADYIYKASEMSMEK